MPPTDVQRRMLSRVVRTFLDKFGQSTPRQDLLIEFQSLHDLDDLGYRHVLRTYVRTGDEYLPTALAFHYCGDAQRENQARRAVQILAKVLRKQFLSRQIKLSREGLEEDARAIDPSCDQKTIELGIYLGPEFNLFQSYAGGNEAQPVITPTRISERIVEIKSPDTLWDDFTRQWKPWPNQDSFGGVISAMVAATDANPEQPPPIDRKWSRDQKIGLAGVIITAVGVVVAVMFPEVRVWLHLQKPERIAAPTAVSSPAPNVPFSGANAQSSVPTKEASGDAPGTLDEVLAKPTPVDRAARQEEPKIVAAEPSSTGAPSSSVNVRNPPAVAPASETASQTGPSPNPSVSDNVGNSPPLLPAPEVRAQTNGFVFVVQGCRRITDLLSCSGSATNKLQRRLLDLNAQTEGISSAVDSNGTQYRLVPPDPHTLVFGASGRRQDLENDVPISFTITIQHFSSTATSVNLLLACWTSEPYGFFSVTLRTVPISQQ
jgi:hypothetical protein